MNTGVAMKASRSRISEINTGMSVVILATGLGSAFGQAHELTAESAFHSSQE